MIELVLLLPVILVPIAFVVVASAFKSKPAQAPRVPPAQVVVDLSRSPIDPPPATVRRVSGGRLAAGLVMLVLGGLGLIVLYGLAGLAQLASH